MSEWNRQDLQLSNLELNTQNPRFEMAGDQREAIRTMLNEQSDKIINLAEDIIKFGLNPSESAIVAPVETVKGIFVVLEGNRRITALKLLDNPDFASFDKALLKKFKELSSGYKKIKSISCIVFDDPDNANKWIKLKHTGENEGVGTVRWNTQQQARFEESVGGNTAEALQVIDFLKKSSYVSQDVKSNLGKVPATNLERIIKDRNMQSVLGITIEDGKVNTDFEESEVVKGLTKVVNDLVSKAIKVKDIYTKKDREKYIETFGKGDLPSKGKKAPAKWEVVASSRGTVPTATTKSRSKKPNPLSASRVSLIPKDCILKISERRINKVYQELKSMNCDEYVNAAAVLMRVFVELSVDAYIERKKLPKLNSDSKLQLKINGVADHLEQSGIIHKQELKGIRASGGNIHHMLSANTFNAYVHNKSFNPVANELKINWDNIQLFVEAIWSQV
ncbi:hypothetical protein [Bdellovibrio svalbardensis]|uniref:ParB/Sulfiredoxin domain-containing protein n=1 Tax=Bdellovibrio svalbardensis TaxID=2972972 RepID=A0ABT6DE78_9BACT|nr:hypothetical protein [Bdellovibrio svalbardensis]MDG0815137.1 hypothetical protein [Bdellovibrio svalbardensis]